MASSFDESLFDQYTDEELLHCIKNSPKLVTTREVRHVVLLSPNFIAKLTLKGEVNPIDELCAIEKARSVDVNAPNVRRIVSDLHGNFWICMDRIHGKTLEQLWPHIGLWHTLGIAWQLRSSVRKLHSVTSQTTGGLHSGRVVSSWIEAVFGPIPHAPPSVFAGFLNWWLTEFHLNWLPSRPHLLLSAPKEHVLVHQDLAPRNMIVDNAGTLWLVDWGHAGYYPAFMEYLGMDTGNLVMSWVYERNWTAWWGRVRWGIFRWFVLGSAGQYQHAHSALWEVRGRTTRFKLAKSPFSVAAV